MTQDVYRLLGELQTIDFFLTEINMYLDSHPQDATALERQQRYQQIRQELDREYQGSIRLLHAAQQQLAAKK
ncbi:spore coat protein JB [Kroppenstedtia sanguinis]|uniref:Spore coat protein CotJB n=1 Tax=Kroppenstedtia sanguinis TaxID=1380684 RepID=A0ABW4C3Q0_9BACL